MARRAAGGDRFAGTGQPQWAGGRGGFVALRAALCPRRCAGAAALAAGRRRAGRLAARLGRGGRKGDHGPSGRISCGVPRRMEGDTGRRAGGRRRWHGLALGTVCLLAQRSVGSGLRAARRRPDPESHAAIDVGGRRGESWRNLFDLLEEGQAPGIQPLGPVADGSGAGGMVQGHRPAADPRRPGAGIRRLSRAHGPSSHGRQRRGWTVQPRRHGRNVLLQRRSPHRRADPRSRQSSRRSPRPSGSGSPAVSCRTMRWASTKRCGCRP